MKLKVTVNGIAYSVDVEVEEEQRKLGSIITGGGASVGNPPAAPTTEESDAAGRGADIGRIAISLTRQRPEICGRASWSVRFIPSSSTRTAA